MNPFNPKEFKVVALRDCPMPEDMHLCDTPGQAYAYWQAHVTSDPRFDPERECLVVLLLNTRRRIKGHHLVSVGTKDTILMDVTAVFRVAVISSAATLVLVHNHPSGEPEPSDADVKATRDLIRAGQLLKVEVLDHIIVGCGRHVSLRELGFFAA